MTGRSEAPGRRRPTRDGSGSNRRVPRAMARRGSSAQRPPEDLHELRLMRPPPPSLPRTRPTSSTDAGPHSARDRQTPRRRPVAANRPTGSYCLSTREHSGLDSSAPSRLLPAGVQRFRNLIQDPDRNAFSLSRPRRAQRRRLGVEKVQEPPGQSLARRRKFNHGDAPILFFTAPSDVSMSKSAINKSGDVRAVTAKGVGQFLHGEGLHGRAQELRLLRRESYGPTRSEERIVQCDTQPAEHLGKASDFLLIRAY